jgi:hypothetical protein
VKPGEAKLEAPARALRQFRRVFNTVTSHFQQVERAAGVGAAQVWALAVVQERPGIGLTGLAQAMDVRQPTASNLVKALVRQGQLGAGPGAGCRPAGRRHPFESDVGQTRGGRVLIKRKGK